MHLQLNGKLGFRAGAPSALLEDQISPTAFGARVRQAVVEKQQQGQFPVESPLLLELSLLAGHSQIRLTRRQSPSPVNVTHTSPMVAVIYIGDSCQVWTDNAVHTKPLGESRVSTVKVIQQIDGKCPTSECTREKQLKRSSETS